MNAFQNRKTDADVIIIGAGLAGSAAAAVLGRQGRRVILLDSRLAFPPVFKAEKIEPDQAELLRKLGLLEVLLPRARRVREIRSYYNGRLFRTVSEEQYGLSYSDMVNPLRANLFEFERVEFKMARVESIKNSADLQRVTLAGGEQLSARLLILACGASGQVPASLGLKRTMIQNHRCLAAAFTLERANGRLFDFDSATCYPEVTALGVDYITFFPIGGAMRANLFAFPTTDDDWMKVFLKNPDAELDRFFPGMRESIGGFRIASKVETSMIQLYGTEDQALPGVALIGDAGQNACPSTGMGVSKVLNDVDLLCRGYIPRWLESAGMGIQKIAQFPSDPQKRAIDEKALRGAIYRRQARTCKTLRWKLHRKRLHFAMLFEAPQKTEAAPPAAECGLHM